MYAAGWAKVQGSCDHRQTLYGQQASEEGAVALEGDAKVFGRDIVAAVPLGLEAAALLGKHLSQALHRLGDEVVGILHRPARFVDEPCLDGVP